MSIDRFIVWGNTPEWGAPTPEKLGAVALSFLGEGWRFEVEPTPRGDAFWINVMSDLRCSFHLASERPELAGMYDHVEGDEPFYRWFQIYFPEIGTTSVITRHVDAFTNALADEYAKIIAKWWHGTLELPS
ncbi:MAG: hypothetical protein AB7L09_03400 [Nitrospira sp.]